MVASFLRVDDLLNQSDVDGSHLLFTVGSIHIDECRMDAK